MTADTHQGDLPALALEHGNIQSNWRGDTEYVFSKHGLETFAAALQGRGTQEAIPRAYISHRACMPPVLDYAATPGALSVTTLYELAAGAQEVEPSELRKAAEFAVKALDEEAAAYYPDAIAHVDEARNRLRAALAQESRGVEIREAM